MPLHGQGNRPVAGFQGPRPRYNDMSCTQEPSHTPCPQLTESPTVVVRTARPAGCCLHTGSAPQQLAVPGQWGSASPYSNSGRQPVKPGKAKIRPGTNDHEQW